MFLTICSRLSTLLFSLTLLFAVILGSGLSDRHSASAQTSYISDRNVYQKPPLPALPRAGGTYRDPVFGTEIMRATDESDCPVQGCGTYYSHWPTFNANNTRLLIHGRAPSRLFCTFTDGV